VKKPKEQMTQEDIDREDDQLITTLIDKFSGGAHTTFHNRNNNEVRLGTSPPIAKRGELMGLEEVVLKKSP
jgi:hypothetical protein